MRATSTGERLGHHNPAGGGTFKTNGIFIGKVKRNVDPSGLGKLWVWIPQLSSAGEADESGWLIVRYCPPLAGAARPGSDEAQANNATKYGQTKQSYGFWGVPPDLDVQVVCAFINGDIHMGVWWCCLPSDGHTHAIPAIASGRTHDGEVLPVGERNRHNTTDAQVENRPKHPQGDNLIRQGLDRDLSRGHSNAGPFRNTNEGPGNAYGILSPGQHRIVLDDGPNGGPGGQVRLQTASGNTLILDNGGGYIYAINAAGTAWFQLDAAGNIDFYAKGDFSVNAEGNINFRTPNNFNIDAGQNVNAVAGQNWNLEACEIFSATGTTGMKLTAGQNMNILADSQMKLTAQRIDLNGTPAERADLPATNSLPSNSDVGSSVAGRVPEREPYGGHSYRQGEQPTVPPGSPGVPASTITPAASSYENNDPPPEATNAVDCVPEPTQSKLSDEGFAILKSREAYRGIMYSDFQGYSIGYGCRLDIFGPGGGGKIDENLKQALAAGPSEAEARLASRQIIDRENTPRVMRALERAKAGKNVCLTQSQIDALIMASYSNPAAADRMAADLCDAAAKNPDGKASNADIARIWANSSYNNSSNARNSDANYAMTGKPNASTVVKSPDRLMSEGQAAGTRDISSGRVPLPENNSWRGPYGNGGQTGTRVNTTYGQPTATHRAQYERSTYLNTGQVPQGSSLTLTQLKDKYGEPHTGGNYPPGAPTRSA